MKEKKLKKKKISPLTKVNSLLKKTENAHTPSTIKRKLSVKKKSTPK